MAIPDHTYVDTFIHDSQKSIFSLKNFYETILVKDADDEDHIIRIPIDDFFRKYSGQLEPSIQLYNLPDRYLYKPKSISLDLYDTTEMWMALMRLNNMINITKFNQSIIRIYNPGDVKELINIFFKREGKIT